MGFWTGEFYFGAFGEFSSGSYNSTSVEVHPDGTGARKASGPQSIGKSRGGWNTKIHMVSTSNWLGVIFRLSSGQAHDAPEGRALLDSWDKPPRTRRWRWTAPARATTRHFVESLGMTPVVPPKANRKAEWDYDKEPCKLRNEVERLFRRLKGYRRIYTRFDKLDVMFLGFLNFALIFEMISGEA